MAPRPLLGVIVDRPLRAALGAGPAHPLSVADHHVDLLIGHRQIHALHLPGRLDPQQQPVEPHIAHRYLPGFSDDAQDRNPSARFCRRATPPRTPPPAG
jgi:hypothetical protein